MATFTAGRASAATALFFRYAFAKPEKTWKGQAVAENKQITPLNFEIDEIGLSVLGWEISDFQARLMMKDYGRRGGVLPGCSIGRSSLSC
jgi:hypothetical protein